MPMTDAAASSRAARAAAQQDLDARRREYLLQPPSWAQAALLRALADERDAPVASLFLNIAGLAVPAAALVFLAPPSHLLGAAYLAANYGLFLARFLVALLHVGEHRRLFRPGALLSLCRALCISGPRLETYHCHANLACKRFCDTRACRV